MKDETRNLSWLLTQAWLSIEFRFGGDLARDAAGSHFNQQRLTNDDKERISMDNKKIEIEIGAGKWW